MFTGIIETLGTVTKLVREGSNLHLSIRSAIGQQLKIDQSVAHNGVCLTVVATKGDEHTVTAIAETLQRSNIGQLETGQTVNLERCMAANGRFDGHIVQGHVDGMATVEAITDHNGSHRVRFKLDKPSLLIVEKGSVTVNGVSLTCFEVSDHHFSVAIIPYTWQHTTFGSFSLGTRVNIEFDIVGKYVARLMGR